MRRFLLLALVVMLPAAAVAQDVRVQAELDSTDYIIGDWIPLTITVEHDPQVVVFPPDFADNKAGELEVLRVEQREPGRTESGLTRRQYRVVMAAYDTGSFTIPPIDIAYRSQGDTAVGTAATDSFRVTIYSAGGDTLQEAHDIKPPAKLPWEFADYLPFIIAAAIILLVVAAYLLWKKFRKRRVEPEEEIPPEVKIDPYELAMRRLTELEGKKLWEKGFVKEHYSEASDIFREYIENGYHIPALEMTTDEILDNIERKNIVDKKEAKDYFIEADFVKFAKFIPTEEDCRRVIPRTHELLREARANLRPPEPPIPADTTEPAVEAEEGGER